jgi:hypothetical protein
MTTEEAIAWAGGTQVLLAQALGCAQPTISHWGEFPPPLRQLQIERLSGGKLKADPDVFGQAIGVPEKSA